MPDAGGPVWNDELIRRAWEAYQRDLPRLAEERPGQWVAYHGERQVGFAATRADLWQHCLERGLPGGSSGCSTSSRWRGKR